MGQVGMWRRVVPGTGTLRPMVARISRDVPRWICPRCETVLSLEDGALRNCPSCSARLQREYVRETREVSWAPGMPPPAHVFRAVFSPDALQPSTGKLPKVGKVTSSGAKVFMSYVREDQSDVDRLVSDLKQREISVWLDREDLAPGQRWKTEIRRAIREGVGVIACFSQNSTSRSRSYMNEELTIIVDEIRARPINMTWFVPVRLNPCEVPDRSIGGGETLRDLQQVDLFASWDQGVQRIVESLRPGSTGFHSAR
jgi:hypothetical protein